MFYYFNLFESSAAGMIAYNNILDNHACAIVREKQEAL